MTQTNVSGRGLLVSTMLCLALSTAHAQEPDASNDVAAPSVTTTTTSIPEVPDAHEAPTDSSSFDHAPIPEPPSSPQILASLQDGFGVRSADGRQVLRIGALFSTRLGLDLPDGGDVTPFANVRLARLTIGGQVWGDHVRYFLNAELAGTGARARAGPKDPKKGGRGKRAGFDRFS